MERGTKEMLERRLEGVNRRLRQHHSISRYALEAHSGSTWLYRESLGGVRTNTITAGTKSEVAHYLWLMMVALDDARTITLERED